MSPCYSQKVGEEQEEVKQIFQGVLQIQVTSKYICFTC